MKLIYIVACKVIDSSGVEIQGIGSTPLVLLEDQASGEALGFIGDGLISASQIIFGKNLTKFDVINSYIQLSGLGDYKKCFNNSSITDSFLIELISGAIEGDLSDFLYENDVKATLLHDEKIYEKFLKPYLNHVGVWVLEKELGEIKFDSQDGSIDINNSLYEDLGILVNEVIISAPDSQVVVILN